MDLKLERKMLDVVAEIMNQQSQGRNQRSSMELGYAGRCKDSDR